MQIDTKSALDILDSGQWVSIAYVSYDKRKGESGRIIRINDCRIIVPNGKGGENEARTATKNEILKNPLHSKHFTRNVVTKHGLTRKLHIRLLFAINGNAII